MTNGYTNVEMITLSSGQEYAVYIPDGCNADTEIVVFEHGSGPGYNNKELGIWNNYLGNYGSDKIVIVPSSVGTDNAMEIIDEVRNTYGITNNNLTSVGYSYGGGYSVEIASKNVSSNGSGTTEPQVVFCLDATDDANGGSETDFIRNPSKAYEEYNLEALKDNTVIFSFEPEGKKKSSTCTSQAYTYYAEQGLNVVRVTCKGTTHEQLLNNFCDNNYLSYLSGGTLAASSSLIYSTYNAVSGEWEEIDVSEIDTLEKLYEKFGISYDGNSISLSKLSNLTDGSDGIDEVVCDIQDMIDAHSKTQEMLSQLESLKDSLSSISLTVELDSGYLLGESQTLAMSLNEESITFDGTLTKVINTAAEADAALKLLWNSYLLSTGEVELDDVGLNEETTTSSGNDTEKEKKSTSNNSSGKWLNSESGNTEKSTSSDNEAVLLSDTVDNSNNTSISAYEKEEDTTSIVATSTSSYNGNTTVSSLKSDNTTSYSMNLDNTTIDSTHDTEINASNTGVNSESTNGYINLYESNAASVSNTENVDTTFMGIAGIGAIGEATYLGSKYVKGKEKERDNDNLDDFDDLDGFEI